eukprot:TRINITY_DN18129_c0_g1_i2.p1 TRINITY_DN18129_c0_g1~~TRINITY_DN18129_c0_g1_i2.p1  ORF type:complete len:330 (-),score=83.47 TRINITY_DN18129_c0_g1_i2:50-997(-)
MNHHQYKIVRKLSTTLQGAIYEALDLNTNQKVAVKVASKGRTVAQSSGVLEDINLEIRAMKQVKSEHVIRLIESFEDSKNVYVVMELAENGDLFSQVCKLQTVDEISAKQYFKEVAQGVKEMHDSDVCHLDISLENVLISKSGALKICDLGVARDMSSTFISTNHGLFRPGKLMYMSPECSNLEEFDGAKSDVYSLGILLFCMLFGFNPYTAESTLKFREFQSRLASTSGSSFNDELLVDEYTEHLKQLQSTKQISIEDLAYGSILCDDADVIFDLYNIRDEVSDLAQDLICSMLCQESQRLSIEAVLQHPWLEQ